MAGPWDVIVEGAKKVGGGFQKAGEYIWRGGKSDTQIFEYIGWTFGREPGFLPDEEDLKGQAERALEAKSPEQARAIIDSIIGKEPEDAMILDMLKDRGWLNDVIFGPDPEEAWLSLDPFTEGGYTLFASGAMGQQYKGVDPWMLHDTIMQQMIDDNPRLQWVYLRDVDPLALMPIVAEQDLEKAGYGGSNRWYDPITDLGGKILGGAKEAGLRFIMIPERIEEMAGWAYYHDIPDDHMRLQMAHNFYEYTFNFWDWDKTHETGARHAIDEIMAKGLRGMDAGEELEKYMAENPMGLAASVGDLGAKILFDPLWLLPIGNIANLAVGVPVRGLTGAPKFARIARFLSPAARQAAKKAPKGDYTWKQILRMDEAAYAEFKATGVGKGALSFLFERDPGAFGRLTRRQLQFRLSPHIDDIVDDIGKTGGKLMDDLFRTFESGKPTGWVKERMPGLLDEEPVLADFSARACRKGEFRLASTKKTADVAEGEFWADLTRASGFGDELGKLTAARGVLGNAARQQAKRIGDDVIRVGAKGEKANPLMTKLGNNIIEAGRTGNKVALQQHADDLLRLTREARVVTVENALLDAANIAMVKAQTEIFRSTAVGRILVDRWMPVVGHMRQLIAGLTLNNPGFVWLNYVSNMARHMWTFARHPGLATRTYSQSIFAEMTAAFPRGGKYPGFFTRRLTPHPGLTPRRVEHFISSQTGMHELLGERIARGELSAGETMGLLAKEASQPIKRLFEEPRRLWGMNIDKLMFPVYTAGRMDYAARRGAFFASLSEQGGLAAVPSWVAKGPMPPLAARLDDIGVEGELSRRVEGQLLDDYRAVLTGELEIPVGRTAEEVLLERGLARADAIEKGVASAGGFSVTDVAWRWSKAGAPRGLGIVDDKAARYALNDIWPMADRIHMEILEPHLKEVIAGTRSFRSLSRMIDACTMEYYQADDVLAQIGRLNNMMRNPSSYLDGLRLSNRVMVEDMADNFLHLERHMRRVLVGWEKSPRNWRKIREFNRLAGEATAEQGKRLAKINQDFYMKAAYEGKESAELTDDLARAWDDYFKAKDEGYKGLHDFVRKETADVLGDDYVRVIDDWYDELRKTHRAHRANIQDAAKEGTTEAWYMAGEKNKLLYESNRTGRATTFGHGPNDPPAAQQVYNAQGPLAQEVDSYATFLKRELKAAIPDLQAGTRTLAAPLRGAAAQEIRTATHELVTNWKASSQQVVGQAMAKTDFIMLNYNNQYGFDRMFQAFMPFFFWPTRDTVHWGIRAARQPGAFVGLWQAMLFPRGYAEQYGLPERLQYDIPIYLPFMEEALAKVPIVSEMLSNADFSPLYFVDPIRLAFPFTMWRDQYEDEQRRGTPAGLALDFMENWMPMASINPFAKIVGAEVGLLDKNAWSSVQFSGGPFGIPLSATGLAAQRWLFGGDLDAIPEEEMYTYTEKGHFSVPFLSRVLNMEPDRFDEYRAERACWALAATDELLPGEPHDVQVRAAMEAVRNHKGKAWYVALRAAAGEDFLRMTTHWMGFPVGGVRGLQEGERIWYGLRTAYSEYAEQGKIDEFFEKYPEFEIRSAVVRGLGDPEAKRKAVDTALFYEDIERIVDSPFYVPLQRIESELTSLADLTQTDSVREQINFLKKERTDMRAEQSRLREIVQNMYPYRDTELSLRHPPRDFALRTIDDEWYALRSEWYENEGEAGESYEHLERAQEEWLEQFPAYGAGGYDEKGWQDSFNEYMHLTLEYGRAMQSAARDERWDDRDRLKEELNAKLTAAHEHWSQGLTRRDVESYLASRQRPKTPEEVAFLHARSLRELWMGLVSRGSPLTSRERGAISDFFRSLPEIQKHYPFKAAPLEAFTIEQRLAMFRRDEIWSFYYGFSDPGVAVDYMRSVGDELNEINEFLGLPPLRLMDYRIPPPELGMGDPLVARMQMQLTAMREAGLEGEPGEAMDPALLEEYTQLLAADPDDPSPLSSGDLDWLLSQWSEPEERP